MRRADGPLLVVISGLPGVGKTSVARALAHQLAAVHLSVDALEDAMLGCGLPRGWSVGVAAYAPWPAPVIDVDTAGRTVGGVADVALRALAQRR